MNIENLAEPSVDEETKIEGISENLYARIQEETEAFLKSQLQALGIKIPDEINLETKSIEGLTKTIFQGDEKALALYSYKGQKILGIRISDNDMAIEFEMPDILQMYHIQGVIDKEEGNDG